RIFARTIEVPVRRDHRACAWRCLDHRGEGDRLTGSNLGLHTAVHLQVDHWLDTFARRGTGWHLHLTVLHREAGAGWRGHPLLHPRTEIAQRLLQDALVADDVRHHRLDRRRGMLRMVVEIDAVDVVVLRTHSFAHFRRVPRGLPGKGVRIH